jgi:RNA polymerase sigma factor (sigma-70 family)
MDNSTPLTSNSSSSLNGLPQHLMDIRREATSIVPSPRRTRKVLGMVALLSPTLACNALSMASTATNTIKASSQPSGVYQARMLREMKGGLKSRRSELISSTSPSLDDEAWVAALFDEDSISTNGNTAKQQAEEFDRFMEENANVASIIKDNLKPGSLVDEVQNAKGADVDTEVLLQMEATRRRAAADAHQNVEEELLLSSSSQAMLPPTPQSINTKSSSSATASATKSHARSVLLTRDEEYTLARAIQLGAHVHKIKSEYESTHSKPLSKRQWATLAGLSSPNELRKVVSEYRSAKQELVASNMGLVHAVVKNYSRKAYYRGITIDELVQEGSLGLIRAAELFDPAKGLRFSTYATIWIKGVLSNSRVDEMVLVPQRERQIWNKIREVSKDVDDEDGVMEGEFVEKKDGKSPTKRLSTDLIAKKLGLDKSSVEQNIQRMSSVNNMLSLDYQYASTTRSGETDGSKPFEALMADKSGSDADLAERAQFKADLVAGLVRNLNEREIQLIRLMYGMHDGHEYSVKDSAKIMGINRETARLLHHACLKKLREASNMESLQEYLLTVA